MIRAAGALLALLLISGCASLGPDPAYVRNGIQYGMTEGPFRGRWWNYYERGRSFSDGDFWMEAEKDFRVAIKSRPKDQLWPRTYGLHFLREYFPHRELGIVLYRQDDRLQEAIRELELSYSQQPSARAAYFLNLARREWVQSQDLDSQAPTIEILEPSRGSVQAEPMTVVAGVVRDDTFVSSIRVDGQALDVRISDAEVPFRHEVMLDPGTTSITIETADVLGNRTQETIKIDADFEGPVVSFDKPVVLPGEIRGVVFDPAGIDACTIGGSDAELSDRPEGGNTFEVVLREVSLDRPVRYTCTDGLGNVTQGVVPVDAAVLSSVSGQVMPASGLGAMALTNRVRAFDAGGSLIAIAVQESASSGPDVQFENVNDGQRTLREQYVVALNASAPSPLSSLSLDGKPLQIIPGRNDCRTSREVILKKGENELVAEVVDTGGHRAEARVTVVKEETKIKQVDEKLTVAFLDVRDSSLEKRESDVAIILEELPRYIFDLERFKLINRSQLLEVLEEQERSAMLAEGPRALVPGQLETVEVLFETFFRHDGETVDLWVDGTSTETSEYVVKHVDVAGPSQQLDELVELLAQRLVQEFPRVQEQLIDWKRPVGICRLTESQGVRRSMKCVVFRLREIPAEDVKVTDILGYGLVQSVGASYSRIKVVTSGVEDKEETQDLPEIQVGDFVITK